MSRTNIAYIVILLAIIGVVAFFTFGDTDGGSGGSTKSVAEQIQPGENLPYTDLQGNPVDLSEYDDNVLVVNSWATWCPFCVNELPDMELLAEEYKDKNVKVFSINRKESPATANAFMDEIGNPDDIMFLLDPSDTFYKSIGGFSMPETVFYKPGGEVSFHKRGFMTLEEMTQHTEAALESNNE